MIKIVSYNMPDMDGVSCMYAYSELLNKLGKKCAYIIDGKPKKEVEIVCDIFNIELDYSNKLKKDDKIILVDTNEINEISHNLNFDNIIEIIDHHHKSEKLNLMPNANFQIEKVGAAATLIAEKFKLYKIEISLNAAILLYYGIILNTMNLHSNTTTERDEKMANWLSEKINKPLEKITNQIFKRKSLIDNSYLRNEMDMEYRNENLNISWTMGQLEIADVMSFINKNRNKIFDIMNKIKIEKNIDFLSVNCIDIINEYTIILPLDYETEKIIANTLKLKSKNEYFYINKILTRKEIFEKIWHIYGK